MRDLPPQPDAALPAEADEAFLALPQLDLPAAVLLVERPAPAVLPTAPPDDRGLHAAPVGVVRLQT